MKRARWLLIFLTLLSQPAIAADPCASLLCLAGKLQGQVGGPECSAPEADYFNIVRFGKHGKFDAGRTATARLGFLNSCPGNVGDWASRITAAYGRLRWGF